MNIKRFFGKSSKEALSMVRKALGDDAVILSNRTINGGNEIMAFREEEIDALINENMQDDADEAPQKYAAYIADEEESHFLQNAAFFQKPDMNSHARFDALNVHPDEPLEAHDAEFKMHADMARFTKRIAQEEMIKANVSQKNTLFAQREITQNGRVAQASPAIESNENTQDEPQQNSNEISAMLKEMREMRNEIETQLNEIKKAEILAAKQAEHQAALQAAKNAARQPVQKPAPMDVNAAQANKPAANKPTAQKPVQQSPQMMAMLKEMRDMRSVFESKLTSLTWNNIQRQNPLKSNLLSLLLGAGFSASLSRQLAEKLPETINNQKMDGELAKTWIKNILALNLNAIQNEAEIFDQGGIFALIGPTGVGKTTTTAKLAARYVMKHGTQNLGIITTDAYRIGGHEQLRIYGKILGVMVHAVKDEADLKIALNELKNKHTILIDTVGVSQRDNMVAEQIAMLSSTQQPIKKLLCINATSTGETLTDVVRAYQGKTQEQALAGCIVTKIDEAATIGNALDVIIRNKLKLYYATNGQRVPEDILIANKKMLIEQAFKRNASTQWPYQFLDEELPFIMGNSLVQPQKAMKSGELDHV